MFNKVESIHLDKINFCSEFHRLDFFASNNGSDIMLVYTDYPFRNRPTIIIHLSLLVQNGLDDIMPLMIKAIKR